MAQDDIKQIFEDMAAKLDLKAMLQQIAMEFWVYAPYEPERNEAGEILGSFGEPK